MSKRRVASQLIFDRIHCFRGHTPPMVVALSGTGTLAAAGVFTVVVGSGSGAITTGSVYITVSSGTNIGTLIGTYTTGENFPI